MICIGWRSGTDLTLMLGAFSTYGQVTLGVTFLAKNSNGLWYGLINVQSDFFLALLMVFQSAFLTLIIGLTGLRVGYNGGMSGEMTITSQQS